MATSGSTGTPVKTKGTTVTTLMFEALNLRGHAWYGRDFRGTFCAIRPLSDFPAGPPSRWVTGFPTGPVFVNDVSVPAGKQLD